MSVTKMLKLKDISFFQTIFHMVLVLIGIISVNCMLYNPYGYITIPYFNFQLPNHSLNFLLIILFFYAVYYSLSNLSFWKRILFSGTIAMYANIFYDMLWNLFYLGANDLPFGYILNLISLSGIIVGMSMLIRGLNTDFSLFVVTNGRMLQLVTSLFIVVVFLSIMFITNFFRDYFLFITAGGVDPHNFAWAMSRIVSFMMWLPILRWKK